MSSYKKPEIIVVDDLAEGIYASSGSSGGRCESFYMAGIFSYADGSNSINVGYKAGYGCHGCPAVSGDMTRCIVNEVEWDSDFRPWWEKQGKTGDEKGY